MWQVFVIQGVNNSLGGNNYEKLTLIFAFIVTAAFAFSQKYAYVDTEYILENIPEYNDAQTILDEKSIEWQQEIEEKLTEN